MDIDNIFKITETNRAVSARHCCLFYFLLLSFCPLPASFSYMPSFHRNMAIKHLQALSMNCWDIGSKENTRCDFFSFAAAYLFANLSWSISNILTGGYNYILLL